MVAQNKHPLTGTVFATLTALYSIGSAIFIFILLQSNYASTGSTDVPTTTLAKLGAHLQYTGRLRLFCRHALFATAFPTKGVDQSCHACACSGYASAVMHSQKLEKPLGIGILDGRGLGIAIGMLIFRYIFNGKLRNLFEQSPLIKIGFQQPIMDTQHVAMFAIHVFLAMCTELALLGARESLGRTLATTRHNELLVTIIFAPALLVDLFHAPMLAANSVGQ